MLQTLRREYVGRRGLLLRLLPNIFREDSFAAEYLSFCSRHGLALVTDTAAYRTVRVDLAPSPERIRKAFDGKWRNQLNAAERNGLAMAEGTSDRLYVQFLALYGEMMARKQFDTTVNPEEFHRIQKRLPEQHKMLIMISAKDGVPQAGLVAAPLGETGIYLLGATSNDGMKSKGSYLLQWRMMNWLKERGCRWYDLGGINPQTNPGVYHFKRGLGGEEVTGLGRLELRSNWLSSRCVLAAEKLRQLRLRFKAPAPATPPAPAVSTE
jgi:lipid II:glycine glycyltransferase (peptidoglycan interpeptide bridge formation enzyme)